MPNVMRECPESHAYMLYVNHVYHQVRGEKMIRSLQFIQAFWSAGYPALGAGSELVVLVLEQDVERGE